MRFRVMNRAGGSVSENITKKLNSHEIKGRQAILHDIQAVHIRIHNL